MKISHLQEADITPSSGPDNMATGQAPKMGRSNDVLETTTSGSIATGEPSNLGTQRRGQKSIFKGIKTSKKFANSRAAGIYEDELSEEQLQARKRREELFKRSKDRGIGKKPESRDIMAKEAFNGEYDDEAGMADNNLETMRRAVDGIDSVINTGDNLPEWCQEKIAVAKSMLVNVWDYMRSEEEISEGDYNNYDNNRTGFRKPQRDLSGEDEPQGMFTVMIDGRPWKEFTSNKAFSVARTLADKNPTKKIQVKWPNGTLNAVNEGMFGSSKENQILPLVKKISDLVGKLNAQNIEVGKKIIQSNTNDIVRMLSPQSKSGVDVIEQGIAEGVNHSALQGWDEMNRDQKRNALEKAGIADSYSTYSKTPEQLDDILHAARVKAQNQEDELSMGAGGRRELQRQAKQDFEEQRQQLHKEKMEMERFAWEKANTEAERKHEMAKIDKQYTQELRTLQMSHMQDMEKILHADTHELNKMKAEFNMRQAEREKAKPEPELQDEPENNQGNNFNQDTGEPIRPNKPQQSNQWHTSQQVGYKPTKPTKPSNNDDIVDVEPKPNKPLALKEKITVVKDPAKATGIQQTGGITHGSVYAGKPVSQPYRITPGSTYTPGKPLPQSLQQKLDGKSNTDRAVDDKGRTQQQWIKAVKAKFPDAKIMQAKMLDGPCYAMLSDGRKLSWNKVEQGVSEEKQRLDPSCWTGYKKQGTKMKGGVRVNNCVPVKESSIFKGLKK